MKFIKAKKDNKTIIYSFFNNNWDAKLTIEKEKYEYEPGKKEGSLEKISIKLNSDTPQKGLILSCYDDIIEITTEKFPVLELRSRIYSYVKSEAINKQPEDKIKRVKELIQQLIQFEDENIYIGLISLKKLYLTEENRLKIYPQACNGNAIFYKKYGIPTKEFIDEFKDPYKPEEEDLKTYFTTYASIQMYSLGVTLAQIFTGYTANNKKELLDSVRKLSQKPYKCIKQAIFLCLIPNGCGLKKLMELIYLFK